MSALPWIQSALFIGLVLLLALPLGAWMARVYEGRAGTIGRLFGPVERLIYRVAGIDPAAETGWREYAGGFLLFNAFGFVLVYLILRFQHLLPANPAHLGPVPPDTALNTATSFVSNTNWQSYAGESTMSYLTQMLALTSQNFLSAAGGMAVLVALIRGLSRQSSQKVGSFWVDLVRGTLYILLPLSLLLAMALASQGVVQTVSAPPAFTPLQSIAAGRAGSGTLAIGPVASQVAIKQLGTNGGGFFNANSAHPFENPTPLSGLLELLAILLIPAALCDTYGRMIGDRRQGWVILMAMTVIFAAVLALGLGSELRPNPHLAQAARDAGAALLPPAGNLEGKEVRNGVGGSVLWAMATTAASNGSVNAMHDSLLPLTGMSALVLMKLGEVVFGGVGSGLYGMLIFVLVTVFMAGLMVGRTPEYLGKKIEAFEIKMASLVILIPAAAVLLGAAVAVMVPAGRGAVLNPGPHGFSEILYAWTSAANNNGSAFAGLAAGAPFYNVGLALAMFLGRYGVAVPVLALAGSLARKRTVPPGAGTLPTHTVLFAGFLITIVIVVGALTYLPVLALGPIVEHLTLFGAR